MIYLPDQVQPGIASRAIMRSGGIFPFFFATRCVCCHCPAFFSSFSLDDGRGVLCSVLYNVIQFSFFCSHVSESKADTDHAHPEISSSSVMVSSDRVPLLYAVRCLLCHAPAFFSSGSSENTEGYLCSLVYCVTQFCFCCSHVSVTPLSVFFSDLHFHPMISSSSAVRSLESVFLW